MCGRVLTSPASLVGRLCVVDPQESGSLSIPALPLANNSVSVLNTESGKQAGFMFFP